MCVLGLYAHVETSLDFGRECKVEITVQGRTAEESTTEFTRRMIENDHAKDALLHICVTPAQQITTQI